MTRPRAIGSRWAGWLGPALAKVRINAVEPRREPGRPPLIAKRRRWFGRWLIVPGNLYLRWLGSGVLVLPDRAWRDRERAVHRRLHGIECETDPRGWLLLPEWPGFVLASYASDPRNPPGVRILALSAAARALRAFHRADTAGTDGTGGHPGHGDATLRNVIFDPATRQARWFDFDTVHAPSVPEPARHADDLRALLYSALEVLADLPVSALYGVVRDAYGDPGPWRHLRDHLARRPLHSDVFHFAQARPTLARREELERLLRRGE